VQAHGSLTERLAGGVSTHVRQGERVPEPGNGSSSVLGKGPSLG
jgi:hypothetical protein